ncbi:hypothetical protein CAEBREN_19183 [Caenorhabditis brenneri]|uniref:Uncharacterized protein n=1 Tax=Caenorhabditis brenneri TaxID=135651 RepID=G0MIA0_CAEBE|nr:hypothetical protein CAEBREN_19183 [Caenorhabditis brenneri]
MADVCSTQGKTLKCSVCKTSKTDAWYKKSGTDEDVLCNFCCDSSGSCEPKEWIGLCVHCLMSEAAYPVYNSGFKQFACCSCYVELRRKARMMRTAKNKEKSSASNEKQAVREKKASEQERVPDNRIGEVNEANETLFTFSFSIQKSTISVR